MGGGRGRSNLRLLRFSWRRLWMLIRVSKAYKRVSKGSDSVSG